MWSKQDVEQTVDKVEKDGQTAIDDLNLLDSWIVTYVMIREGWRIFKRLVHYARTRRRG